MSDAGSINLTVFLVASDGEDGYDVPVTLSWDPADPFAVKLSIINEHGIMVDWFFARDLLWAGLDAPAGIGDVRVFPGDGNNLVEEGEVEIRLYFPLECGKYTRLFLVHQNVKEFLESTRAEYLAAMRQFGVDLDEALDSGEML